MNPEEIIRWIVREEIGRNLHTVNTMPYHFSDMPGYDVEIMPTLNDAYLLAIRFEDEPLTNSREFNTRAEAELFARNVVDRHRVSNGA